MVQVVWGRGGSLRGQQPEDFPLGSLMGQDWHTLSAYFLALLLLLLPGL